MVLPLPVAGRAVCPALYPEADRALRDRLDRFHEAADDAK
jgi:hypothetical protein